MLLLVIGKISYDTFLAFGIAHNGTSNEGGTKKLQKKLQLAVL